VAPAKLVVMRYDEGIDETVVLLHEQDWWTYA
jgi:hypothetical protein